MKGHIRERSPAHWAIVLDMRDPETGKRKRRSLQGAKRDAQPDCSRLIAEFAEGAYLEPSKTTIAAFLEKWRRQVEPRVAARTFERDQKIVRKNLVPFLGQAVLTKVRPDHTPVACAKALKSGRRDGSGGLSPRAVYHIHRLLRSSARSAWGGRASSSTGIGRCLSSRRRRSRRPRP